MLDMFLFLVLNCEVAPCHECLWNQQSMHLISGIPGWDEDNEVYCSNCDAYDFI